MYNMLDWFIDGSIHLNAMPSLRCFSCFLHSLYNSLIISCQHMLNGKEIEHISYQKQAFQCHFKLMETYWVKSTKCKCGSHNPYASFDENLYLGRMLSNGFLTIYTKPGYAWVPI